MRGVPHVFSVIAATLNLSEGFVIWKRRRRTPTYLRADGDDGLSKRIRDVQQTQESFIDGIQKRVNIVSKSQEFDDELLRGSGTVELPTICFDALLPNQRLSGSTTDPTFMTFLRKLGLGGSFVMTSLNNRQRRMRRFGVVAKIEFVDMDGDLEDCTAVSFVLLGRQRCEIMGPADSMSERIGRWRRGYDPDGEESRLGWGPESFVKKTSPEEDIGHPTSSIQIESPPDVSVWTTNRIRILDDTSEDVDPATIDHATRLIPLVERWIDLASDESTYDNTEVVAATRRKSGEPGLSVDAAALIRKVQSELGEMPRPSTPTAFCLWVAALINPLPPLGVSTECRGAILEAKSAKVRLEILERTLVKSLNNLDGTRPLNM